MEDLDRQVDQNKDQGRGPGVDDDETGISPGPVISTVRRDISDDLPSAPLSETGGRVPVLCSPGVSPETCTDGNTS